MKTCNGKLCTYNDGNKIEARDSFVSVRTNNCLVKGKWCYEVLLESNGLFQIGFCQLKTVFNSQYGVGDDIDSFGYDGYRLSCWNGNENRYGKIWDYGDIIGICIDLDNNHLEYFQNGESLGIITKNIETGPGLAYFPAISFSEYEKCSFNFGSCPLIYNYPGYEPMDIPKSQYNGSFEVTSLILQSLNQSNLLDFLDSNFNDIFLQKLVNQKIFYFLINISFKDYFLCKCLLFPFIYSLLKKKKTHYQIFLKQLSKNVNLNENKTFFDDFFEKLTNLIEEYSIMGVKFYNYFIIYTELFIEIINNNEYFNKWSNTRNFFGHLRNIFNSNTFHFRAVYDKINEIYGDDQYSQNMGAILKKIIIDGNLINKEMIEKEEKYFDLHKLMIEKIFNYYETKSTICQATFIFYDLMRACYPINTIKEYINDLYTFMSSDNKKNILGFKNVILSYIYYFFENYKNIDLNELPLGSVTIIQLPNIKDSIRNELSQTGIYVSYFREENIGGKSSNFIKDKKEIFNGINKKSSICFNLLVRLISLIDKFFFAYYELQSLSKDYIFGNYIPSDQGTTLVNSLFRYYFYLFNEPSQVILYNISFFLIKWINNEILIKNKSNILLLPLYLIDFPFQIAQLMLIFKSKILFNDNYRKEINSKCELFEKDDFLESLCSLYINLFGDYHYSSYISLTYSLGWKIYLFLREKITRNIIMKNEKYIKDILIGITNIINNNNSERVVLRILTVFQKTNIENQKSYTQEEIEEEENNTNKIKKLFSSLEYKIIFTDLIHYISKNLNSKLVTFCNNLDTCKHYCIDSNFIGEDIARYNNNLKSSFQKIISLVNIYEFTLNISNETFFNYTSLDSPLIYIRNFFVIVTSHILEQPYFGYLEMIFNYISLYQSNLIDLIDSIVNLILICHKENKSKFYEFIITTQKILIKPLLNAYNYGINIINKKIENNENYSYYNNMKKKYTEYLNIINELEDKRKKYDEEYIKKLKDLEYLDDEFLCVICLRQIADYKINPCNHKGCKECLLTYMVDNDKCFMCRQEYNSVTKIPNEEIEKIIINSKKTKTGDEEEENNIKENNDNI